MRFDRLQWWFAVGAILALPVMGHAQEAALSGTVSDATGGALPGVAVTAVHEASGNTFETVTDAEGTYRLGVRVGDYELTAALAGFGTVTQGGTLLIGQEAVVDLEMTVGGVQETVTVTGEAPLLDLTQSSLGGNIDPRQLSELPVQGRDWTQLVMLAPGSRTNYVVDAPVSGVNTGGTSYGTQSRGDFQFNIDGQQVTQTATYTSTGGQPRFSRDSIAEFEFVSSRFDATQGRSAGVQVNAITKSGTNTPGGSFAGYFRDDSMNAEDFVAEKVIPYSDAQLSWTFGGPIQTDRLHYFGNYEYEREPRSFVYSTGYPHFDRTLTATSTHHLAGLRLDRQFSPRVRLSGRGTLFRLVEGLTAVGAGGSFNTPMNRRGLDRQQDNYLVTLTNVISNTTVNEVRLGRTLYAWQNTNHDPSPVTLLAPRGFGGPTFNLITGLRVGGGATLIDEDQRQWSIRDDLTTTFGNHTIKAGGEYIALNLVVNCCNVTGTMDARGGAIPDGLEAMFPDLFDATSWKLDGLSDVSRSWVQTRGAVVFDQTRHVSSLWLQDDWAVTDRMTLNLGLRYDLEVNAYANATELIPFLTPGRPNDTNNFGPRFGMTYSINDQTLVRGGIGVYYGWATWPYFTWYPANQSRADILNDGRANFASDPWNGPPPTFEQLFANQCLAADPFKEGCVPRSAFILYNNESRSNFSYQTSIGLQRQLSDNMSIDADYIYIGNRANVSAVNGNVNLTYDANDVNHSWFDRSLRNWPEWGFVSFRLSENESNLHSLQMAWTKRMSGGWQAGATYTLAALKDRYPPAHQGYAHIPFREASRDLGGEYGLGVTDQRHRTVFNAIWQMPYDFQLSGMYFWGSGERLASYYGGDNRKLLSGSERRLRNDGTVVDRNTFVGGNVQRMDMRIQKRLPLGGPVSIDGILEIYNVFNHANYGSYVTQENNPQFGSPQQFVNVAFFPRVLQLGFRLQF